MQRKRIGAMSLSELEREWLILPLQRLRSFDLFAQLLGYSAQSEALLPLFATLYWCIDQHKCLAGIWLVPIAEISNGCVKWLTRRARPAWVDQRVRLLAWSSEFSFPSSHAQIAWSLAVFFVLSSQHAHAVSVTPWWPVCLHAALVGVSRIHVGVHYPSDVVVGSAWGAASAAAWASAVPPLLRWRDLFATGAAAAAGVGGGKDLPTSIAALCAPLLVCALALALAYRKVRRDHSGALRRDAERRWRKNACRGRYAGRELEPLDVPFGSYCSMLGVLFGLALGITLKRPLAFPTTTRAWLARAIFGNLGLVVVFEGVAALTPRRPLALYAVLRLLKYALVPIYILLIAPPAFRAAGL